MSWFNCEQPTYLALDESQTSVVASRHPTHKLKSAGLSRCLTKLFKIKITQFNKDAYSKKK